MWFYSFVLSLRVCSNCQSPRLSVAAAMSRGDVGATISVHGKFPRRKLLVDGMRSFGWDFLQLNSFCHSLCNHCRTLMYLLGEGWQRDGTKSSLANCKILIFVHEIFSNWSGCRVQELNCEVVMARDCVCYMCIGHSPHYIDSLTSHAFNTYYLNILSSILFSSLLPFAIDISLNT